MSLSVGKTCSKLYCGTQDFLPIKCSSCQQTFCREHISIGTGHECQGGGAQATGAEQWIARQKCELKGCEKPSLDSAANVGSSDAVAERVPAVCDACGGAFCVRYGRSVSRALAKRRFQRPHVCHASQVTGNPNLTTASLLLRLQRKTRMPKPKRFWQKRSLRPKRHRLRKVLRLAR